MADARIRVDTGALSALLGSPGGPVAADLMRRATWVQALAKRYAPVDKGQLRNSITTELRGSGKNLEARIGTNVKHAIFVHEGTGVYAGKGPIRPRRPGGVLAFDVGGQRVFAREVNGTKPNPFLRRAVEDGFR